MTLDPRRQRHELPAVSLRGHDPVATRGRMRVTERQRGDAMPGGRVREAPVMGVVGAAAMAVIAERARRTFVRAAAAERLVRRRLVWGVPGTHRQSLTDPLSRYNTYRAEGSETAPARRTLLGEGGAWVGVLDVARDDHASRLRRHLGRWSGVWTRVRASSLLGADERAHPGRTSRLPSLRQHVLRSAGSPLPRNASAEPRRHAPEGPSERSVAGFAGGPQRPSAVDLGAGSRDPSPMGGRRAADRPSARVRTRLDDCGPHRPRAALA
jgi:hypothetical protein